MIIPNVSHINLEHIFDCGQCFRWNKAEGGAYRGVVGNEVVTAYLDGNTLVLDGAEDTERWRSYFDLNSDYQAVKDRLNKDKILKKCIQHGYGIRILRQEPWEALVSFIISANNNIPRIKKIIEALCLCHGNEIEYNGGVYYSFPSAEALSRLTTADLAPIRAGFRDKYIIDAALKVASGEIDLNLLYDMPANEARKELLKIKGVGKKVADCVLLFAYGKMGVFPQDVWIKSILAEVYNAKDENVDEFARDKFGDLGGFAQQYLFYYYREMSANTTKLECH